MEIWFKLNSKCNFALMVWLRSLSLSNNNNNEFKRAFAYYYWENRRAPIWKFAGSKSTMGNKHFIDLPLRVGV